MKNIKEDLIKIKIRMDINKKVSNYTYQKLLLLVKNILFFKKLNQINISNLEKIIKYENVFISTMPQFEIFLEKNNQIFSKFISVSSMFMDIDSFIDMIKKNQNDMFYIFTAMDNYYRFTKIEDLKFKKKIRKIKLKTIF